MYTTCRLLLCSMGWLFLVKFARAQGMNTPLTPGEVHKVLNAAFSNLVNGSSSYGEFTNAASLDPVNALFSLKGTIPFMYGKKKLPGTLSVEDRVQRDEKPFSYLGITLSGGLQDKSYAKLVSNGTLNAGVNLQVQYNFRWGPVHRTDDRAVWQAVSLQKDLLFRNYRRNWLALEQGAYDSVRDANLPGLCLVADATRKKFADKKVELDRFKRYLVVQGSAVRGKKNLADSLGTLEKSLADLQATLDKTSFAIDSINLVWAHEPDLVARQKQDELDKKLKKDYDSIILKAPLVKFSLVWYTLTGGVGETSYSTYDPTRPFSSQIVSNSTAPFNGGFAINYINLNQLKRHVFYASLGVSYGRSNNLSSLTTTEVDQTKTAVNTGGDTTRTISSKYNVYTAPVTTFLSTTFTGNVYYTFGKTPSGIHFSPSICFQDNGLNITRATIGYVVSFKNAAKDQPVINTELYVAFKDIFNQQKMATGLFRRAEVGLSFTVPFNVFIN